MMLFVRFGRDILDPVPPELGKNRQSSLVIFDGPKEMTYFVSH